MLPKQSKLLNRTARVLEEKERPGTIVLVNSIFLQIKWDNGKISYHRHDGMQGITLIKAR